MKSTHILTERIDASIKVSQEWISKTENLAQMVRLETEILDTLLAGNKLFFFGNGGSAAEASHLAAEFVGKCLFETDPFSAICLNDSAAAITAIANDWNFLEIFSRQIRAHCQKGDLVIGLSTSGSKNVTMGLDTALDIGCNVWLFTSLKYNEKGRYPGAELIAPTIVTSIAQELHLQIGHAIVESLESKRYHK